MTRSNIRIYSYEIFGHERISDYIRIKTLIRIYSYIRSSQKISYEYIRIFVRVIFLTRIYSDIRSCQNPYECHTLVQTAYFSAMWSTDHYNFVEDYDEDEENRQ